MRKLLYIVLLLPIIAFGQVKNPPTIIPNPYAGTQPVTVPFRVNGTDTSLTKFYLTYNNKAIWFFTARQTINYLNANLYFKSQVDSINALAVHKAGTETITAIKNFTNTVGFNPGGSGGANFSSSGTTVSGSFGLIDNPYFYIKGPNPGMTLISPDGTLSNKLGLTADGRLYTSKNSATPNRIVDITDLANYATNAHADSIGSNVPLFNPALFRKNRTSNAKINLAPGELISQYVPTPIKLNNGDIWVYTKGDGKKVISAFKSTNSGLTFAFQDTVIGRNRSYSAWSALNPHALFDSTANVIRIFYSGYPNADPTLGTNICYATASTATPTVVTTYSSNPVLTSTGVAADFGLTGIFSLDPSDIIVKNGVQIMYVGIITSTNFYLCYYTSTNWVTWTKGKIFLTTPITELIQQPSVFQLNDSKYYMYLTRYDKYPNNGTATKRRIKAMWSPDALKWNDLPGDFLVAKGDTTWQNNSIYAGHLLKDNVTQSKPVTVNGFWQYYYSASNSLPWHESSDEVERAGIAYITPYTYDSMTPDTLNNYYISRNETVNKKVVTPNTVYATDFSYSSSTGSPTGNDGQLLNVRYNSILNNQLWFDWYGNNLYTRSMLSGTNSSWERFVKGTGSTNYLTKWTGAGTTGNGSVYDNGSGISIGGAIVQNKITLSDGGTPYAGGINRFLQLYTNSTGAVEIGLGNTNNLFAVRASIGTGAENQVIGFVNGSGNFGLTLDNSGKVNIPGSVASRTFITGGSTPTATVGTSAGSGASVSFATGSNNQDGKIIITCPNSVSNGAFATVTMADGFAYAHACAPVLQVDNAVSGGAAYVNLITTSSTATTFTIFVSGATASGTYIFNYHNGGY